MRSCARATAERFAPGISASANPALLQRLHMFQAWTWMQTSDQPPARIVAGVSRHSPAGETWGRWALTKKDNNTTNTSLYLQWLGLRREIGSAGHRSQPGT